VVNKMPQSRPHLAAIRAFRATGVKREDGPMTHLRRIVLALVAAGMLASPMAAMAGDHDHDHPPFGWAWGHDKDHHHDDHHHDVNRGHDHDHDHHDDHAGRR
jgi:hypothetical protein